MYLNLNQFEQIQSNVCECRPALGSLSYLVLKACLSLLNLYMKKKEKKEKWGDVESITSTPYCYTTPTHESFPLAG